MFEAHNKTMNDESVPTLMYPNVQIFIFLPTFIHVINPLVKFNQKICAAHTYLKNCVYS